MPEFKVKSSDFKTPPEDSYFFDLVWIEQVEGDKGPYLRWHWIVSDIDGQKDWSVCRASSQTPLNPTMNNRFGQFIEVLTGGLQVDDVGSTEALVAAKYRVKAFLEHNKKQGDRGEVIYCNVTKLIEGTAKKGEGIGYKGVPEKLKETVNAFLQTKGIAPLPLNPKDASGKPVAKKAAAVPVTKQEDLTW